MKEFNYTMKKALAIGLRPTDRNKRGQQALVLSTGAYPDEGALSSLEDLEWLDTSAISPAPEFPYPQIFKLKQVTIVCTANKIYEYDETAETLTLVLSSLTEGHLWTVADFGNFIAMVNGMQSVFRDGVSKQWTTIDTYGIISASSICNLNGQIIVTAPQTQVSVPYYLFENGDSYLFQNGDQFEFN